MATLFQNIFASIFFLLKNIKLLIVVIVLLAVIALILGKVYQGWDDDPDRGAIAIANGTFGENYSTPIYLDQGWSANDSLWFYNTTQGSALLPYDFFLALEQENSTDLFRDNQNIDRYRYLPQKPTFFNPEGFPVGFVQETYKGKDYIGYTCAACHTGQVNYQGTAIRIDGGPAMADMVGFLTGLEKSMLATQQQPQKKQRFVQNVLELSNDYSTAQEILQSLDQWTRTIRLYNTVNHSHIDYGYARLDAFGRIYNRVLQHMINKPQLATAMKLAVSPIGNRILTNQQIDKVLDGIGENIIVDKQFGLVFERLASKENGYPGLNQRDLLRVRNQVFNEADAPTSYPFLWDIAQSDYVQWNGVANNSGVGPLGRNTGEVIGVFGILDWTSHEKNGFSLSAILTGQEKLKQQVDFTSSIDLTNLRRLESHLKSLQSPVWPREILGEIDLAKAQRGQVIYAKYCLSCHEVIERNNWDRLVVAKMSDIGFIGTDKAAAVNGVAYSGKSGNLKHTVQSTDVGDLVIEENAPVIQILTSATKGVIGTPDADKYIVRRWLDRLYDIGSSFFDNTIRNTIKNGNYKSDTTSSPYNSLLAYKARSLNGIWATAPYLHNGSVPSLYDLLLPQEERPSEFMVGSREFDPVKVGFRAQGYDGFRYTTMRIGDKNTGHEYGAGRTPQLNGEVLPALDEAQRWDLIEYIKTL
ncbi:di-heme-cytochrome C peroxidase [Paraglaciecola aquimarina]|uniref:Di-heme-cytochrome C peroxidase n=1 Tax=Paraglaciecola algarum TaxID=3050085 RepID=A0ABS9D2I1_9ALTE|nr:di-heme-cytochrome C peroxidase [Paraglaciecola sp. G1-23]MCF2947120.1 di-heme-cytochrome C peroxidase [Paraglaciecola sp. G1-23]